MKPIALGEREILPCMDKHVDILEMITIFIIIDSTVNIELEAGTDRGATYVEVEEEEEEER
jgi:hypothetical protein